MQTKLDSFFKVNITYKTTNKKCFIYDPDNTNASFVSSPNETDVFIDTKCDIKLFYRPSQISNIYNIPNITTNLPIPLLKSNLQKAIRRCENNIALTTTIALIQQDSIELFRRLPIIYIEDVCLLDSLPIIVWLMMADKQYKLTNQDIFLILKIVNNLCDVKLYYDEEDSYKYDKSKHELSHSYLQNFIHKDCLLSLLYRSQYGGMKGDIVMLKNAIYYYLENSDKIQQTCYNFVELENIGFVVELINEAIDFHPLPQLLVQIKNKIKIMTNEDLDEESIKMCIWFCESGVNVRKINTIQKSEEFKETQLWNLIKPNLIYLRKRILVQYA